MKKLRFVHLSNRKCKEDETHGEKSNEHGQAGVKWPISFPFFAYRVTISCPLREEQWKECGLKQHSFHPSLRLSGFPGEPPGRLLAYPPQDAILAGEALTIHASPSLPASCHPLHGYLSIASVAYFLSLFSF